MEKKPLVHSEILEFYTRASEKDRLKSGLGPLEFERNKILISRFLSDKKQFIADIGGGPGIYSEWLAKSGHSVTLIDPIPKHIEQAGKRSERLKNKFQCLLGEACNLELPDNSVDVIVLHGPLYHLPEREQRLKAIQEAERIARNGGIILGFGINYMVSTILGLLNGFIHNKDYRVMCIEEITKGQHKALPDWPGMLPEAYFHRPEDLKSEFAEAGLEIINLYAVEGIIWLDKNYFESRAVKDRYDNLIQINELLETDSNVLSLSPHMMIAAKKV